MELVARSGPVSNQCSTARPPHARHYLNSFRGEPAITEFAELFTPTHRSSHQFSTWTGAGLHRLVDRIHPGHG